MAAPTYSTIDRRIDGRIARVTIANPAELNTLRRRSPAALDRVAHEFGADPELRA